MNLIEIILKKLSFRSDQISKCLVFFVTLTNRAFTVRPLEADDIVKSAELLSRQFSEREPLSVAIGVSYDDLLPWFTAMLNHLLTQKTVLVLVNKQGEVVGCSVTEDYTDPFVPNTSIVTPKLEQLSTVFEACSKRLRVTKKISQGEVYRVLVGAVEKKQKNGFRVLGIMTYSHFLQRGFRYGFAEISNDMSFSYAQRINSIAKDAPLVFRGKITNKDLEADNDVHSESLINYDFSINLFAWSITRDADANDLFR